ncbi:MAG: LLM class F420-dependent oxidoreductase [Acidimicrobiales bacterium]|nr:LLM class F420-dependent oxidoreductase [Acidimicrobiales bacterium]MCB9395950.1 LLM class F420-dependent oxidoreductase [Acidimicrobiaceae bacterium]
MDFGIHFMNFTCDGGSANLARTIADTAVAADEVGASWFTFMDHWFQMEQVGGPAEPMLEGYTCLGYVAAVTRRVRLGLLVTGVTYRHPGLLAKIVTTLDVLSEGRAMLGLGAAWYDREHLGLGVPYPPTATRFEQLEETLQIVGQMWSDDDGAYEGTHFRLAETINVPQPIQPRPPILIGGTGERKTLRLVAQYADACNIFGFGPEFVQSKLEVLYRHCDDLGRDPSTIQVTILGGPDPLADTDAFLTEMERYAAIGVDLVQLRRPAAGASFVYELGERVVPRLAEIGR